MIKTEMAGNISLKPISDFFVENLAASAASRIANEFALYVKQHRFDEYYENKTGETKGSIGVYRGTAKKPVFVVKAGLGIRGSLNYLAGLYKGEAVSRSGKTFSYARPRDLIKTGWKEFGGAGKLQSLYEQTLQRKISEAEAAIGN